MTCERIKLTSRQDERSRAEDVPTSLDFIPLVRVNAKSGCHNAEASGDTRTFAIPEMAGLAAVD